MTTYAIIGNGAASCALIETISKNPKEVKKLYWIGPSKGLWGPAYGQAQEEHCLNVPAGRMGIGREGDFLDFLQVADSSVSGGQFVSRKKYAQYLSFKVEESLELLKSKGVEIHRIDDTIESLTELKDEEGKRAVWRLTGTHVSISADRVILCTGVGLWDYPQSARGNSKSEDSLRGESGALEHATRLSGQPTQEVNVGPHVWVNPYEFTKAVKESSSIEGSDGEITRRVLVIGMGLTGIDVCKSLKESGVKEVFMWAPSGQFPASHRLSHERPPVALIHKWLVESIGAYQRNPKSARSWVRSVRALSTSPEQWIDEAMPQAQRAYLVSHWDWRDVLGALREHTPLIWKLWSPEAKAQWLRHMGRRWEKLRHRVPPESLADALSVSKNCVLKESPKWRKVNTQHEVLHEGAWVRIDHVVNATGIKVKAPSISINSTPIHLGALELGIEVDSEYQIVQKAVPIQGVHYVGGLLKEGFWEATAMPEIVTHTKSLWASIK